MNKVPSEERVVVYSLYIILNTAPTVFSRELLTPTLQSRNEEQHPSNYRKLE